MAPWIPRMHLFEIDDQPWFPAFLRAYVQTGLTHAWTMKLPILQSSSPAGLVADILRRTLSDSVSRYTYIDFCAGAGGPTPYIEQALNRQLRWSGPSSSSSNTRNGASASSSSTAVNGDGPSYAAVAAPEPTPEHGHKDGQNGDSPSYAAVASTKPTPHHGNGDGNGNGNGEENGVEFILTDLHPHISSWEAASKESLHLTYIPQPVDASAAPTNLIRQHTARGKKVFRLFNLAFHHFDDNLARAILKNTVETSDGFGIFELQSRHPLSMLSCASFGAFVMLLAPLFYWSSPQILFFIYCVPIVPFVLVFDGLVSSLRTRTREEVELLLRTCGAAADTSKWVVRSGEEQFLWPIGYMNWIVCTKEEEGKKDA
ncbi:hypothetical protein F4780DRAFT_777296 [Xylariomycetidae sp. FL0641]|nr:hypothetical protein F4780DRAFT_777296 [Xylariomycetidae sp. FL0641]